MKIVDSVFPFVSWAKPWVDIAVAWYNVMTSASWWPMTKWVGGIVIVLIGLVRLWYSAQDHRLKARSERAAKRQDDQLRLPWFRKQDFEDAANDYVIPYCSNVDPSDREDLRNTVAVREPVFDALLRDLVAEDRKYILVLADSGMGKTTLLLNLVARQAKRFRFALVPLGEVGALTAIAAVPEKRDTILLLDAFDEDIQAIEDAASQMGKIMLAAAPFKCVVMTCRTQFFPSDDSIPRETGIKRVAARRAGAPVIYQWLTVYLQPFDRVQIDRYIRKAIPWHRIEQRKKAMRIVQEISDLAARPMLTALIPSLAASRREAHSLWDLYSFMVDTWIQRESSWIEPGVLRRISKAVAVEMIERRSSNGSERLSRQELVKLAEVGKAPIENWKLTSRSLLNRDAGGFYKFAHRSILEFFFIKAFVEGNEGALTVKWTDMMCDLFLSWGSSAEANDELALRLLSSDFRPTGLFPVVERHQPSPNLNTEWVKHVFSSRASTGARAKFPSVWRSAVAYVVQRGPIVRAYDFADGLVWQLDVIKKILEREERDLYLNDRYSLAGVDHEGRNWAVVDLYELKLLCDILAARKMLHSVIDDRVLYWLADTDGEIYTGLARIRPTGSGQALAYRNLEYVQSESGGRDEHYTIDVYRSATKGIAVGAVRAMVILAHHGDAAALLAENQLNVECHSWGIRRDKWTPHVRTAFGDTVGK